MAVSFQYRVDLRRTTTMSCLHLIFTIFLVISLSNAAKRVVRSPQFSEASAYAQAGGFGGPFSNGFYPHRYPYTPHFYPPPPPPPPPPLPLVIAPPYGGFYPPPPPPVLSGYGRLHHHGFYPHGYGNSGFGNGLSISKSVSISTGGGEAQSSANAYGK